MRSISVQWLKRSFFTDRHTHTHKDKHRSCYFIYFKYGKLCAKIFNFQKYILLVYFRFKFKNFKDCNHTEIKNSHSRKTKPKTQRTSNLNKMLMRLENIHFQNDSETDYYSLDYIQFLAILKNYVQDRITEIFHDTKKPVCHSSSHLRITKLVLIL